MDNTIYYRWSIQIIDSLYKKIDLEVKHYLELYHRKPKYVKIPLYLWNELVKNLDIELDDLEDIDKTKNFRFMGLIIVETPTISTIDEVEVL